MEIGDAQREMRMRLPGAFMGTRFRSVMACVGEFGDIEHTTYGYYDAGSGRIFHFPDYRTVHPYV